MFRIHLNRILNISVLLFLLVSLTPSYSKTIYKWVDEDGTIHFTDDPKNIPEDKKEKAVVIEGEEPGGETDEKTEKMVQEKKKEKNTEENLEKKREEEALREDFR